MARITEEDPATKAAREAEEATASAKKKADDEAAAAAQTAADAEAAAKKKADDEAAAAAAIVAAKAKKDAGEELSDDELALLEAEDASAATGGITVTIGEEEIQPEDEKVAPQWVKDLRKDHREQAKRLRELEEENKKLKAPAAPSALGVKPTLEGCDYDEAKFEAELTKWFDAKRNADAAESTKKAQAEAEQAAWQKKLDGYKADKSKLDVQDFDEAEAVVTASLSVTQQGIIIQGADNPRLVVYALGKNPKKAEELAAIKDPLQFAFAVAKLETQMKITQKKTPPAPDKPLGGGSANLSGSVDSQLETLRAEAEKSGDYTKVNKYKSDKRKAEAAKK